MFVYVRVSVLCFCVCCRRCIACVVWLSFVFCCVCVCLCASSFFVVFVCFVCGLMSGVVWFAVVCFCVFVCMLFHSRICSVGSTIEELDNHGHMYNR